MKIRIVQQVLLKDKINTFRAIYKDFESKIIPRKGDFIYDNAFRDPYEYEVNSVTINYEDNECHVILGFIEIDSEDEKDIREYIKISKMHGWTCDTI